MVSVHSGNFLSQSYFILFVQLSQVLKQMPKNSIRPSQPNSNVGVVLRSPTNLLCLNKSLGTAFLPSFLMCFLDRISNEKWEISQCRKLHFLQALQVALQMQNKGYWVIHYVVVEGKWIFLVTYFLRFESLLSISDINVH